MQRWGKREGKHFANERKVFLYFRPLPHMLPTPMGSGWVDEVMVDPSGPRWCQQTVAGGKGNKHTHTHTIVNFTVVKNSVELQGTLHSCKATGFSRYWLTALQGGLFLYLVNVVLCEWNIVGGG